jgi:hypothetical protein
MTSREAARPLQRYGEARVRAASLPPSYTITRDTTVIRADGGTGDRVSDVGARHPLHATGPCRFADVSRTKSS